MGFEVIMGSPMKIMCPVDYGSAGDTLYVGQIVKSTSDGVAPLGTASGAADTTNKGVPFGVVIGTNNKTPLFDTTYKGEYVTSVQSQANQLARDWFGAEGMWSKGDPQAMVEVAVIDPSTILKGRIFNAAYGTAPTVVTVTTGSTTGAGYTAGACDFTPVADLCTTYCKTGANMGLYRITTDTSTTVRTVALYFPYDIAVGDTFVSAPLRPIGRSYVQFDGESTYINAAATPATDYYVIDVIRIDLSNAGDEHVIFRMGSVHFDNHRS